MKYFNTLELFSNIPHIPVLGNECWICNSQSLLIFYQLKVDLEIGCPYKLDG